jgi:hypothetical protein
LALAADYEIFGATSKSNYYAVERFDHKHKKLYHCVAAIEATTVTAQCTEAPGAARRKPAMEEQSRHSGLPNVFDHVP